MNIKQAAQAIRDSVDMDQILALYGYKTGKGRFMRCPFHGEKTASLKVYSGKKGWHCFGCDRGGSVIDFVKEHENCDFGTAVRAIDNALHLRLMDPHENPFEAGREERKQRALDEFVTAVYAYADAMIRGIEIQQVIDYKRLKELEELRYGQVEKITAADWDFMLSWKDNDEYAEYRIDKIKEFKEEVAAWRRTARGQTSV